MLVEILGVPCECNFNTDIVVSLSYSSNVEDFFFTVLR
jgi:hypothetical protein